MVVLLLLASALAGCVDDGSDDDADSGDDGTDAGPSLSTLPWSLTDCRVVVALVPVSADAVEAHLPEGFRAGSGQEAFGLPPDVRGDAVIGLESFACASGTGLNDTVDHLAYGAYFTAVVPPDEHAVDEADVSLFKWDTLVPDAPRRAHLEARGMPVVDGATDLSGLEETPLGHRFDVTLQMAGDEHRFQGTADQPAEDFRKGFYFVEHMAADEGLAAWHMPENEAPDALSGTGIVTLAAGSLPAQIVGGDSSQAFFASATTVQFVNGTIELP